MDKELRLKKLRYRLMHRGCKETDVLFARILDEDKYSYTEEDIGCLEQLCDENDWDIYAWLLEKYPFPAEYPHAFAEKMIERAKIG